MSATGPTAFPYRQILELDPGAVAPSPFQNRSRESFEDPAFKILKGSVERHGQLVPILVRPGEGGRYVCVYGHRRLYVAHELGIRVTAIVHAAADQEAALLQGLENSSRCAPTFYERALFAEGLVRQCFPRRVIAAALGVDETSVSRMLMVAQCIPCHLVGRLGDIRRIGRPTFVALAEAMNPRKKTDARAALRRVLKAADTDLFEDATPRGRIGLLLQAATLKTGDHRVDKRLASVDGRDLGVLAITDGKASLRLATGLAGFAEHVADQLPTLYRLWQKDAAASEPST